MANKEIIDLDEILAVAVTPPTNEWFLPLQKDVAGTKKINLDELASLIGGGGGGGDVIAPGSADEDTIPVFGATPQNLKATPLKIIESGSEWELNGLRFISLAGNGQITGIDNLTFLGSELANIKIEDLPMGDILQFQGNADLSFRFEDGTINKFWINHLIDSERVNNSFLLPIRFDARAGEPADPVTGSSGLLYVRDSGAGNNLHYKVGSTETDIIAAITGGPFIPLAGNSGNPMTGTLDVGSNTITKIVNLSDSNDRQMMLFTSKNVDADNYFEFINGDSSEVGLSHPTVRVAGASTNMDFIIQAKGTGMLLVEADLQMGGRDVHDVGLFRSFAEVPILELEEDTNTDTDYLKIFSGRSFSNRPIVLLTQTEEVGIDDVSLRIVTLGAGKFEVDTELVMMSGGIVFDQATTIPGDATTNIHYDSNSLNFNVENGVSKDFRFTFGDSPMYTFSEAEFSLGSASMLSIKSAEFNHTAITAAATVAIDFDADEEYRTLNLTASQDFTSSGGSTGKVKTKVIKLLNTTAGVITYAASWPDWKFVGNPKPISIGPNNTAVLTLISYGTNETDVVATYVEQI